VISGGELTNAYTNLVNYKTNKPELQFFQVPGSGKIEYRFIVSGKGKITIEYSSRKAGNRTIQLDL